ncbi:MAG: Nif3-like dinuclear metal center hexameric protein [Paludibacter sp.]|nr:Nif3-like dinuclear metal center hexameric protein [Paludibacter sp.]
MYTVSDICRLIEDFAPLSYQETYDNAGLILGSREMKLTGALICLDVTEAVIDEAISLGLNMIVSHHPLIFKGIKSITGKNYIEDCLVKAIKNDVAIYAGHTNVDSVRHGVNGKMAEKLGLQNCRILVPVNSNSVDGEEYGLGMVGDLPFAENENDFLARVKNVFHCHRIRYSEPTGKPISRVALCGGSGSEFIEQARIAGADVFLTGEARYHEFFTKGQNILMIDAGHYETEQFTKEVFFDLISKKLPTFAVRISRVETNPVYYL